MKDKDGEEERPKEGWKGAEREKVSFCTGREIPAPRLPHWHWQQAKMDLPCESRHGREGREGRKGRVLGC